MPKEKGTLEDQIYMDQHVLTESELTHRFWTETQLAAQASNLEIPVPCATVIRDLILVGVRKMFKLSRTSETDLAEAEENWSRFVEAMIKEAQEKSPGHLREHAFVAAKKLRPLWPFC